MLPRYPLVEQETAKDAVLGDGSVRMAGEAVSGRYGARHAVADEAEGRAGGPQRHPASDDRSLVDRLLAGNGDDRGYDWGWGDPATGELVTDREPLHDIPELWGPQEDRDSRGDGDERSDADGASPLAVDDRRGETTRSGPLDEGANRDERFDGDDDGEIFVDRDDARAGLDRAVGERGLGAPGPAERASGDHGFGDQV